MYNVREKQAFIIIITTAGCRDVHIYLHVEGSKARVVVVVAVSCVHIINYNIYIYVYMFIRYYTWVVIGCSRLPGALRDSVSIRVSDGNIITSSYNDHHNNIAR